MIQWYCTVLPYTVYSILQYTVYYSILHAINIFQTQTKSLIMSKNKIRIKYNTTEYKIPIVHLKNVMYILYAMKNLKCIV